MNTGLEIMLDSEGGGVSVSATALVELLLGMVTR